MVLTFLNDFTKRTSDLWKKSKFNFNRTLKVNVDGGNSLSWEGEHKLVDGNPNTEIKVTQKEKGLGQLEFTLGTADILKFKAKSKELVDNCEVEVEMKSKDEGKFTASYHCDQYAAKCEAKYAQSDICLDGQVSAAWENITFGARGSFNPEKGLQDYNVGVRLDQDKNRTYALRTQDTLSKVEVAFYYKVSADTEVGTQVDISMKPDPKIGVRAGGSHQICPKQKVRFNLNCDAELGLAYEYKLAKNVQGFVGTRYNLRDNQMCGGFQYKMVFDC